MFSYVLALLINLRGSAALLSIIAKLNVILKSECEKGVRRIPPEEFPPAISPNQISPGEFPPPPKHFGKDCNECVNVSK